MIYIYIIIQTLVLTSTCQSLKPHGAFVLDMNYRASGLKKRSFFYICIILMIP